MREFANICIENAALSEGATRPEMLSLPGARLGVMRALSQDGEVFTVELTEALFDNESLKKELIRELSRIFRLFLKKYNVGKRDLILVLGVGNEGMTADALGAKTLKYLDITEQYHSAGVGDRGKGRLAAIAGGVSGVTGIASFDVAKGVVERVNPKLVFAVDTLASRRAPRLQRAVQITDTGLVPGSGVNNSKEIFSINTLGVPVIAVGVPLVIYAKNILSAYAAEGAHIDLKRAEKDLGELVVTVKEIDVSVDDFAKVIASGLNHAIHKS
ncbi:MAG: GPR endopeptidase [Clostridia bacterium]|nr:GPR endopeptidase [Clostridia bacterium]